MLDCNFKLYAVRRVWDQETQYWDFWMERWVTGEFGFDCMNKSWVAENIAKEYGAELVPIRVSVKEGEE